MGCLGYNECKNCQTFAVVFSTSENLPVTISGALEMKESHFLFKNVFCENAEGHIRNGEC